MRRRGDIGVAGEARQIGDELLAGGAARHVAGVKLQVAAMGESGADLRQRRRMARQIAVVERGRAKIDRPRRPVTDDRDRRQAGQLVGRKEVGDLLEAGAAGIEDKGRFARRQPGKQILQIRDAGNR